VHDPEVLIGALEVFGQHADVAVGVAGDLGELFAQVAHGEHLTPGIRVGRGRPPVDEGGELGQSPSPRAGAKSRSTTSGQPGPSHASVTSQAASVAGLGGATAHAAAYMRTSSRRSAPTIPDESSTYISAVVIRSTALRSAGTAVRASPGAIRRSQRAASSRAAREYSRRTVRGSRRRSRRSRFTSSASSSVEVTGPFQQESGCPGRARCVRGGGWVGG
jgi:hypothetical protein